MRLLFHLRCGDVLAAQPEIRRCKCGQTSIRVDGAVVELTGDEAEVIAVPDVDLIAGYERWTDQGGEHPALVRAILLAHNCLDVPAVEEGRAA